MEAFIPPSFNLPLLWIIDLTFPILAKLIQNLDGIEISREHQNYLRTLRNHRLIYASNHPTTTEPIVAYYVANVIGSRFYYMASRQVFDWGNGLVGKFIQNVGAFSVLPGATDLESIKTSRKILSQRGSKLVLFPEGEPTSGENDNLMPFQPGVVQLAFWAYEDIRKQEPDEDIFILPAFVKYILTGTDAQIKGELHQSLQRIEKLLGIDPKNKNFLQRILTIGRILLEQAEKEYQITPEVEKGWDYRIGRIRHEILDQIAKKFQIQGYDYSANAIEKLRYLLSIIEMKLVNYPDPRLPNMSKKEIEWAQKECLKAYSFITIHTEYLISYPTAERMFEWLKHYEEYLFGQSPFRPRKAIVRFSPVISIKNSYEEYKKSKKTAVKNLTDLLRREIQILLEECKSLTKPIVRPYDV
ncbi:MAG: 1-acyl-sn-glycerol-3-phosphate acyltransferase [Leptospiraceae bacterium]|nr:1-acyl-sn-glycerol-3-phosphate acyltransferase [Leptospiraceae bacterium]MDW7976333.1 1-acyl-sn-glycerol-3-phosphate acyltransferase [Leptospiraceae bacterium]